MSLLPMTLQSEGAFVAQTGLLEALPQAAEDTPLTPLTLAHVQILEDIAAAGQYVHEWSHLRRLFYARAREVALSYEREAAGRTPYALLAEAYLSNASGVAAGRSGGEVGVGVGSVVGGGGGGGNGAESGSDGASRTQTSTSAPASTDPSLTDIHIRFDEGSTRALDGVGDSTREATISAGVAVAIGDVTLRAGGAVADDDATLCAGDAVADEPSRKRARCEEGIVEAAAALAGPVSTSVTPQADDDFSLSVKSREALDSIRESLADFSSAPWTLQRLAEVLSHPRRFYPDARRFLSALFTLVAVDSRIPPVSRSVRLLPAASHAAYTQVAPIPKPQHAHPNNPQPLRDPGLVTSPTSTPPDAVLPKTKTNFMQALADRARGGSSFEQTESTVRSAGGGGWGVRAAPSRGAYSEGLSALSHLYADDEGDDEVDDEDDALIAGLLADAGPSRDDDADNADMGSALFEEPRRGVDVPGASDSDIGWAAPAPAADWALVDENAGGSGSGSSASSSAGDIIGGLGSLTAAVAGGFRSHPTRILSSLARPRPTTIFDDDETRKPLSSLAAVAPPTSASCDGPDDDIFEHVGRGLAPSSSTPAEAASHDVEMT